MLFNSFQFFGFFAIILIALKQVSHKNQNRILLIASYIFYGTWDWRFLGLIFLSTLVDYIAGQRIFYAKTPIQRKQWLMVSIFINLTTLGFFKYFNFFIDSISPVFSDIGLIGGVPLLNIILPVGISFYTFQTMTYSIDIYRKEITPTRNFFDFALFVAFFPQLVAGPIERAKSLLPQILNPRTVTFEQKRDGIWLILWGLFKKVVIADNIASLVDPVFSQNHAMGPMVVMASYAFAIQIYCDFSGYTDIARGVAKLMGFELIVNFNLPFFAHSPSNFWRRWHISLSTWLRDYLYIPLGGSKFGAFRRYRNLMVTMLLGGLWHGAAWTFVLWGAYQGALLVVQQWVSFINKPVFKLLFASKIINVFITFNLMAIGWLIFRAQNFGQIINFLQNIPIGWSDFHLYVSYFQQLLIFSFPIVLVQLIQYKTQDMLWFSKIRLSKQAIVSAGLCYGLFVYAPIQSQQFIYFQF